MVVPWLFLRNIYTKVINWVGYQVPVIQKHARKHDRGHCMSNDPFIHATKDNQSLLVYWRLYYLVASVTMKTSVKNLMNSAVQP